MAKKNPKKTSVHSATQAAKSALTNPAKPKVKSTAKPKAKFAVKSKAKSDISPALTAAADQESTPNQLCKLAAQSPALARVVAANPAIDASVVKLLKKQKDPKVNRALAANPGTPMADLLELGEQYTSEFVQNPIFDLALAADPRFMTKFPETLVKNIITNQQTPKNIFLWCVRNASEFEFENAGVWLVEFARRTDLSEDLASKLAADAKSDVRVVIARRTDLSEDLASKLAKDAKSSVRCEIAKRTDLSEELTNQLAADAKSDVRVVIARRTDLSEELTNQLAADAESIVRLAIAKRKDLSKTLLIKLAGDSDLSVCQAADIKIASWPKLPEKMLRQIAHRCTTDSLRVLSQRRDLPEDLFYIFDREDDTKIGWEGEDDYNDGDDRFGNRAVKNLPDDLILNLIDSIRNQWEDIKKNEGWDENVKNTFKDEDIIWGDEDNYSCINEENLYALPQWALLCLNLYAGCDFQLKKTINLPSKITFKPDIVFKTLNGHNDLSLETLQKLAKNSDRYVRCAVAQRSDLSLNLIRELSNDTQACVRGAIAQRADIPEDLVISLAADLSWYVRCAIADRKSLPVNLLEELLRDEIEFVSTFARAKLEFNLKSLSWGAIELGIEPIHDKDSDDEESDDEESDDEESDDEDSDDEDSDDEDSDDDEKIVKKSPEEIYYEHPYHRISSRRRIYLSGKTVVIFGLSDEVSAELSARFKAAGAVIANNVSSKTNILVTNQAKTATPGTIRNAIAFGAEVWDEASARAKLSAQEA